MKILAGVLLALSGCAGANLSPDGGVRGSDGAAASSTDLAQATDAAPKKDGAPQTDGAPAGDASSGGACNDQSATLGAQGGPDSCSYGSFCPSTKVCAKAPVGNCAEASGAPSWDQAAKLAPVIISATAQALATTSSTTECLNGDPAALVTIAYYAPGGLTTHTDFADLTKHAKFKVSASPVGMWVGVNFQRMKPPANAQFGSMQVGVNCGSASGSAALYIADEAGHTSNPVCVSW